MPQSDVTKLLESFRKGDTAALDRLFPIVYDELRVVAHRQLLRERADHTLNTTAIVHEVYLKLVQNPPDVAWTGRRHFLAVAGRAMRHILVNYAKAHKAEKRGGGDRNITFDEERVLPASEPDAIVALEEALLRLTQLDERQVRVVECRYFTGLTIQETAEVLGISEASVSRAWSTARLWLNREIKLILGSA